VRSISEKKKKKKKSVIAMYKKFSWCAKIISYILVALGTMVILYNLDIPA
jgi:putative copper export protein